MKLTLEVVSPQASAMGPSRRFVLGHDVIDIGREESCQWVLRDPYVSRKAARIRFLNGLYFVEALGRSPVMLNDRTLQVNDPQVLSQGDRIFIDAYEISVNISAEDAPPLAPQRNPFAPREAVPPTPAAPPPQARDLDAMWSAWPAEPAQGTAMPSVMPPVMPPASPPPPVMPELIPQTAPAGFDPLKSMIGGASQSSPASMPPLAGAPPEIPVWAKGSVEERQIELPPPPPPPPPPPSAMPFPDDWFGGGSTTPAEPRQEVPPPSAPLPTPPPATASVPADLSAFLKAAGLDPSRTQITPDAAAKLGAVMRTVVHGTMEVLRSRAQIKDQFRLPGTRVQQRENNPLKFAPSVDEALSKMLLEKSDAYLPADVAFEQAFDEIRAHQLAMLEAVRTAFANLMKQLDPATLERQFESQAKSGIVLGSARARYWDQYTNLMRTLAEDPEQHFNRLFGNAFGAAYEQHLAALRSTRQGQKKP